MTKIHYGWIIVLAGFIIMAAALGVVYNCASLFVKPISEELGFSRSQANAIFTIRAVCQMIAFLFAGKILNKIKIRRLMQVSTITLVVSFFSYSFMQTLLAFYIITFIVSMSVSLISILPLSIILSNWFQEKRGLAVGIAFMGSGVGGMIFSSLTGYWLVSIGWRMTYQVLSVIMFLLIAPITFFIIRTHPRDKNLAPYGKIISDNLLEVKDTGLMLNQAIRSVRFWVLALCSMLMMLGVNAIMATAGPHLTDIGYSIPFSANIVALSMGSLAIGKVVLGKLFDNFGSRVAITISGLSTLIGILGLMFAELNIALAAVIIGTGVGCAYGSVAGTMITVDLYGKKDYSSIFGLLSAIGVSGAILGPILIGYLYDLTGSYDTSYKVAIVGSILAIVLFQYALRKPYPKNEQR